MGSCSKRYSDKELLTLLLKDAKKLGRTPKLRELSYRNTLVKRFGSYNVALEMLNLQPSRVFYDNLKGQKFGQLTAMRQLGKEWVCLCECGSEVAVVPHALVKGQIKHCKNCSIPYLGLPESRKKINEKYRKGGSFLPSLTQKTSKNNKTGVKGVSWIEKKQRYVASLKFQGKSHYLGSFKTLEEATKARLEGEEKYFNPLLENA